MREDETARSAAMQWFGIRGRAQGQHQTLTGVDLSSLIASVVHAVEAERWSGVRDVRPNETATEAKHETNVTIDVDIATVIDRAVEREFMRAEKAEGRVHALETELVAVRKNLTEAHEELKYQRKRADENFDTIGNVERQLAESNVRIGALVREKDTLDAHANALVKSNDKLHAQVTELRKSKPVTFGEIKFTATARSCEAISGCIRCGNIDTLAMLGKPCPRCKNKLGPADRFVDKVEFHDEPQRPDEYARVSGTQPKTGQNECG